ncbi:MAG: hypothetical protein AABY22_12630, partial [Nanoarchaeota archaeon]
MKNIVTGPITVDNYPYGGLKCKMTFSVEFSKKKGYRSITQSVNPKTGRLNNPKKSTYSHFLYMVKEEETGHIKFEGFQFYGYESIEKFIELLKENSFSFNNEESQELFAWILVCLRGNMQYTKLKEGFTNENLIESTKFREFLKLYKENTDINEIKNVDYKAELINSMIAR